MRLRLRVPLIGLLLVTTALAGCVQLPESLRTAGDLNDVPRDPSDLVWDVTGNYSKALVEGVYDVLPVENVRITSHDGTEIAAAFWRPDVPEGEKVPVILDVGPYYGDWIDSLGLREEQFFVDNFVKNGYAYGRVAVRGTSTSAGCMEFFGPNEQKDVDEAVTFFGTEEWSNGNVALYGASYDGTTPWVAASFGNPHLKTIVPVSGLTDVAGLMFRNGTSEFRGPIMHSVVYWTFYGMGTLDGGFPGYRAGYAPEQLCEEFVRGTGAGPYTAVTGDRATPGPMEGYWEDRDWRERVLENYNGSVYLVHGLQDWNVEPSMAYPFMTELEDAGIEVKHMLGQWGHDWPDRASREKHVRWDWAQLLLDWFDKELKGKDVATGAGADVEDNQGLWRTEETWPPRDANWTVFHLGDDVLAREPTAPGEATVVNPAGVADAGSGRRVCVIVACIGTGSGGPASPTDLLFELGTLDADLRFAGLPQLHVTVTPSNPNGGHLFAELLDVGRGGQVTRVAHAVMDLRYHAGGTEPQTLTAGEPVVAKMEFFPADVLIPAGHKLVLRLVPDTPGEPLPSHTPTPIKVEWGDGKSVLNLPVIERDVGDGRYPGQPVHG